MQETRPDPKNLKNVRKKPRLLVLTSTYPRHPDDPEPGFVHELSRRLAKDFEVRVIGPHAPDTEASEIMDGVNITRYRYAPEALETLVNDGGIVANLKRSPLKWLLVPGFLLGQVWKTWRAIRKWKPDIIHAHWLFPQGFTAAILHLLSTKVPPFLVTSHGTDLHGLRFWPMPALKRFTVKRASSVTVVSSAMLAGMKAQGMPIENVQIKPMGVDLTGRFTPDKAVSRSKDEILFVGRLVEVKGVNFLIEAMTDIVANHPEARLTIAGFGPDEQRLRQQAETLGLNDKINFLGPVSQHNLPQLYRRAAIFVAPFIQTPNGLQEGLGLVTVEAIGCGCPAIVSDLPATRDVIADGNFRTPPASPEDIARSVSMVFEMGPEQKANIARKQREQVECRFDWKATASSYRRLLCELLPSS